MGFLDRLGGLKDRLLGGDEYYDDYDDDYIEDDYVDEEVNERSYESPRSRSANLSERRNGSGVLGNSARPEAESVSVYTRSGERVASEVSPSTGGYTTPTSFAGDAFGEKTVQGGTLAPVSSALPPSVLKPQTYNDIQSVIRRVRGSQAVVLDLRRTPIDAAKRILDFSFGLACGIDGSVEELDDRVFCVLPRGVGLSSSDTERLVREGILRR